MNSLQTEIKLSDKQKDFVGYQAVTDLSFFPQFVSANKNPLHIKYIAKTIQRTIETESSRNRLIIVSVPPRHGKTELISKHFPAWYLLNYPKKRVILTSYAAELSDSNSMAAKNNFEKWALLLSGGEVMPAKNMFNRSAWNTNLNGGVTSAGVGGPITGFGADVFIIDDYIKGHEDAESALQREKIWNWWQAVASTRLHPGAVVIILATRWHDDDLIGRLITQKEDEGENFPFDTEIINLPAIAEENDLLGRYPGAALWPDRYNKEQLLNIQKTVGSYWWNALYQGNPTPRGGGMFKIANFRLQNEFPRHRIVKSIRYWDKAATEGGGCNSAGVLMHRLFDGTFVIEDSTKGQWSAGERNTRIKQIAQMDGSQYKDIEIWHEQEPGSGGKESAEFTTKDLAGYRVHAEKVTGSKESRAEPYAIQVEAQNVIVLIRPWTKDFLREHETFPLGKFKDQVDASSGAFNKLTRKPQAGTW